ncbi:UbiA family prenyltransferase [Ornithinimicrobium sp. Arc0846-15]|nr:UbiA family prenyltransferase [Ornithinimicrobium laminariae]
MTARQVTLSLIKSAHPLPTAAVTVLTVGLVVGAGGAWVDGLVVVFAVFAGQLVIGWSNDLIDTERDRAVGRADKPLAQGDVGVRSVRVASIVAAAVTVITSLLASLPAAALHLSLGVGSGLAYNFWLKRTAWSWLPYALAFGVLPAVAWLGMGAGMPPYWMMIVGALLGVGAHLLNVLPDLADDEAMGVRGLPHRIGEARTRLLAALLLFEGSVIVVFAPPALPVMWSAAVLLASAVLAVIAWKGSGKTPFVAAIALAVLNVIMLIIRG